MNSKMNFETISISTLSTVGGGTGRDFAGRYVDNLKQDWNSVWNRADRSASALNKGNVGEGAKQFGAGVVNALGMAGDAIAPVRAAVPQS